MHVLGPALVLRRRLQPRFDALGALPQHRRHTLAEQAAQEPEEDKKRDDLGDQRPVNLLHTSVYSANFGHGFLRQVGENPIRQRAVGCCVE